jgi:hypothetical protein
MERAYKAIAERVWTNILHTSSELPWDERAAISFSPAQSVSEGG